MKEKWKTIVFKIIAWKGSGTYIISQLSFEEITASIDEDMILAQQMMSSCI